MAQWSQPGVSNPLPAWNPETGSHEPADRGAWENDVTVAYDPTGAAARESANRSNATAPAGDGKSDVDKLIEAFMGMRGGGSGGGSKKGFTYEGDITPGRFSFGRFRSNPWEAPELEEELGAFDSPGGFVAPTMEDVANDPGYQFRLKSGQEALERSAIARGNILTGGTAKDLESFAQELASTEYEKMYGRRFNEWQSEYNRQFGEWQAEQNRRWKVNEDRWNRSLQQYQVDYNRLFGEHQQAYQQARDSYAFEQQNMMNEYNAARDAWQSRQSSGGGGMSDADRFLMLLAGL